VHAGLSFWFTKFKDQFTESTVPTYENATAHKVNSYYTVAISCCTFCVGKHTISGPDFSELTYDNLSRIRCYNCTFAHIM